MKVFVLVVFVLSLMVLPGCAEKNENRADNISNEEEFINSLTLGNTSHVSQVKGLLSENNIPTFSWYNEEGQEVNLASYKGKVIVINFWATWCPPCRTEIPDFISVYNKYKSQEVEFLGISLDSQLDIDELADFVAENEITYQIILDDGNLDHAFGSVEAIPTTFIIGKDFKVKKTYVGSLDEASLEKLIKLEL
jgi:peroxiredoxin